MKEVAGDPVMALNPYTGKLMNVEPLFHFLKTGEEWEGLDDVIKHISLNEFNDEAIYLLQTFEDRQSLFLFLYEMRDMFRKLRECEITMPKQKGGKL